MCVSFRFPDDSKLVDRYVALLAGHGRSLATSSSLGSSRQLFLLLGVDLETGGEQTNWMNGRTKGDALG